MISDDDLKNWAERGELAHEVTVPGEIYRTLIAEVLRLRQEVQRAYTKLDMVSDALYWEGNK